MRVPTCSKRSFNVVQAKSTLHLRQCRFSHTINLTQLTLTKNDDAVPKAQELEPFVHDNQADVTIDLWSEKPRKQIGLISLRDALAHHIKPGVMLVPHSRRQLPINEHRKPPGYTLKNMDITVLESTDMVIARQSKAFKRPSKSSRRFIFGLWGSQNLDYYMRTMNQAWHLLLAGSRVEMHLQWKDKLKDQAAVRNHIAKYLHLRPNVILRSMPPYSSVVIQPHTDHKKCCWTMGGAHRGRDGSVEKPFDQTWKLKRKRETKQDHVEEP